MLRDNAITAEEAVRRAAERYHLTSNLDEATADVERSIDALRLAELVLPVGPNLQLEYPIAGLWEDGQLISGYIDFVAVANDCVHVLDFKSDMPPETPVEQAYPKYTAQVSAYGRLIAASGILEGRRLRCGLLFTADGNIRWTEP